MKEIKRIEEEKKGKQNKKEINGKQIKEEIMSIEEETK